MENMVDKVKEALEEQKAVFDKVEVPGEFESRLRKALRGKKPGRIPVYYGKYTTAIAAAACVILLLVAAALFRGGAYPDAIMTPAGEEINGFQVEVPTEQGEMSITPLKDHYYVKGTVGAYEEPAEIYGVTGPDFIAYPGISYRFDDVFSNPDGLFMAKISEGERTGWIPYWYLTEEAEGEIHYALPQEMIISEDTMVYPHPQTQRFKSKGLFVEKGKVVHVIKVYEDWMCVDLITYDNPYSGPKWIHKQFLQDYNNNAAMEGTLRPGADIMDENGRVTGTYQEHMGAIRLGTAYGDKWSAYAAGGMSFYIDRGDYIPNPFQYLRRVYPKWRAEYFQNAQRIDMRLGGDVIASIDGSQIDEFSQIISQMVVGPNLWEQTGEDRVSAFANLVLHLPDGLVVLDMSPNYIMEHESVVDVWNENQRYMLYQDPIDSRYSGLYEKLMALFGQDAPLEFSRD